MLYRVHRIPFFEANTNWTILFTDSQHQRVKFATRFPKKSDLSKRQISWQFSKYFPFHNRPLKSDCVAKLAARAYVTESMEREVVAGLIAKLQPVHFANVTM